MRGSVRVVLNQSGEYRLVWPAFLLESIWVTLGHVAARKVQIV